MFFSNEEDRDLAEKLGCCCMKCVIENPTRVARVVVVPIDEVRIQKTRFCPNCNKTIIHTGDLAKNNCSDAIKKKRLCRSCAQSVSRWQEETKKRFSESRLGKLNPNYRHGKKCKSLCQ